MLFSACGGGNAASYEEQIRLGYKLIDEGKYEEAIVAFNSAIVIDVKLPQAYVGLADTYVTRLDENTIIDTEDALRRGYEQDAAGNGKIIADAILRLADKLVEWDKSDWALKLLEFGYELTNDERIDAHLSNLHGISAYEKLSEDDKVFLSEIASALLGFLDIYKSGAYGNSASAGLNAAWQNIYSLQGSERFRLLVSDLYQISGEDMLTFFPRDDTAIFVFGSQSTSTGTPSYHFDLYTGTAADGFFLGSKCGGSSTYLLHVAQYKNGKANGINHDFVFPSNAEMEAYVKQTELREGFAAKDPQYISISGNSFSSDVSYEVNWWHDWPDELR
jgi:hypothetical protein